MSYQLTKDLVRGTNRNGEGWVDPGVGEPFTGSYANDDHKNVGWCSGCEYIHCFKGDPIFWCMRCGYPNEGSWPQAHNNMYEDQHTEEIQASFGCLGIIAILFFAVWIAFLQGGWSAVGFVAFLLFVFIVGMIR